MSKQKLCDKAIAYIRTKNEESSDIFKHEFNDELEIVYLIDEDRPKPRFINNRNLEEEGITAEELQKIGLNNVIRLVNEGMKVQEYNGGVFSLMLDGIVDTSLILIDGIWDMLLEEYVTDSYIIGIPSREMMVFCDSASAEGIEALKNVNKEVLSDEATGLITSNLYKREDKKWVAYKG